MTVSIIMCSYNSSEFIERAICCIQSQTYTDWELIISDDASTDNTLDLIQPYLSDKRIKLNKLAKNHGYVLNKNIAMKLATGELITQLDSDDMCPVDRIEKQVNVFLKNSDIKICGTGYRFVDTKDKVINNNHDHSGVRKGYENDTIIEAPRIEYPFWFPNLMWKRELFNEFGYFSEYFSNIYGDDHYWTIQVNKKYPIYYLADTLYDYRSNPSSITNVLDQPRKLIAQDIISELYRQITTTGTDWLQKNNVEEAVAFEHKLLSDKMLMAKRYSMWAAKAVDEKKWDQAKKLLGTLFTKTLTSISAYRTLIYYLRSRYLST